MMSFPRVAFLIVSTETPGALSNNLNPPSGKTARTANSVTIFLTHLMPVNGKVQLGNNLLYHLYSHAAWPQ